MFININIVCIIVLFIFAIVFTYLEKTINIKNKLIKTFVCFFSSVFMAIFTTALLQYIQFKIPFVQDKSLTTTIDESKNFNLDTISNLSNDEKTIINETAPSISNKIVTYIEDLYIVNSDKYTGNEGDSFVYKIGQHKFSRGNIDINGNKYIHGLEIWIARWNYTNEISWAYSIFKTNSQYSLLNGKVVLINSYNTDNFDAFLYFYNEDELLQKYHLTPDTIPLDIELNITNVDNLKIYIKDNIAVSGGTSFGLVNCTLK